jgi:hypothetical protein
VPFVAPTDASKRIMLARVGHIDRCTFQANVRAGEKRRKTIIDTRQSASWQGPESYASSEAVRARLVPRGQSADARWNLAQFLVLSFPDHRRQSGCAALCAAELFGKSTHRLAAPGPPKRLWAQNPLPLEIGISAPTACGETASLSD